jgi:hypothetical protein
MKVSSTYQDQQIGLYVTCSSTFFPKSSMKKLAITEESGEPIATLSVCSSNCPSKQKYVDVSTCLNNARTSS